MVYICPNCCRLHINGIKDCEESKKLENKRYIEERKYKEKLSEEAKIHEKHCTCRAPKMHVEYLRQVRKAFRDNFFLEEQINDEIHKKGFNEMRTNDIAEHKEHCPLCPDPALHIARVRALKSIMSKNKPRKKKIMIT